MLVPVAPVRAGDKSLASCVQGARALYPAAAWHPRLDLVQSVVNGDEQDPRWCAHVTPLPCEENCLRRSLAQSMVPVDGLTSVEGKQLGN